MRSDTANLFLSVAIHWEEIFRVYDTVFGEDNQLWETIIEDCPEESYGPSGKRRIDNGTTIVRLREKRK